MAYNYASLIAALETTAVIQSTDPNWLAIQATILDQAEQRAYRDLDLINCIVRDTSASLSSNSRNFTLPQSLGYFRTVKAINVVVNGVRHPLRPVSIHFIDATCPSDAALSTPSVPQYFAPLTDQAYIVAPAPDSAYGMEVIGTIRPTPLSASNSTTYLTLYYSDLLFSACMVGVSAYQRDYGASSDDPRLAVSWEQQYLLRLASASKEEAMRKFQEFRPAASPAIAA